MPNINWGELLGYRKWATVQEMVAALSKASQRRTARTVRNWLRDGTIKGGKVLGRWMVDVPWLIVHEFVPPPSMVEMRRKLSDAQVAAIRQAVADGDKQSAIAERYGVHPSYVWMLAQGLRRKSDDAQS